MSRLRAGRCLWFDLGLFRIVWSRVRRGEGRAMTWSEFELDVSTWDGMSRMGRIAYGCNFRWVF